MYSTDLLLLRSLSFLPWMHIIRVSASLLANRSNASGVPSREEMTSRRRLLDAR